jgi:hypothetical protein
MVLTKIFHVDALLQWQCMHQWDFFRGRSNIPDAHAGEPRGVWRYTPQLSFLDLGTEQKLRKRSLAELSTINETTVRTFPYDRTKFAPVRGMITNSPRQPHQEPGALGPDLLVLSVEQEKPMRPYYVFAESGKIFENENRRVRDALFLRVDSDAPPVFMPWAGRPARPPSRVWIYRVHSYTTQLVPSKGLCTVGEAPLLPQTATWQFWVYEKPDWLGRGIWVSDNLCRMVKDSLRAPRKPFR